MHRIFIDPQEITAGKITLQGEALKKVRRVLRLKPGERLLVFDDTGREYLTEIISFASSEGELRILDVTTPTHESSLEIHLGQALPKSTKMDFVIQKSVELGVTNIYPFYSSRTIPLYEDDQIEKRVRRWQKIAQEASRQSGRTCVPKVCHPVRFTHLLEIMPNRGMRLILQREYAKQPLKEVIHSGENPGSISFLVGPEGGFTTGEIELAAGHGFIPVGLGERVLRTETVALVFMSIVQYALGDIH